jgi:hypothetical protein
MAYHLQGRDLESEGQGDHRVADVADTPRDVDLAAVDAAKQVTVVAQPTVDHLAGGNVSRRGNDVAISS